MAVSAARVAKRRESDVMKLMMSDYEVFRPREDVYEFIVRFPGPKDTHYEGGVWLVHVTLPSEYPIKSPSIGFYNRMTHPNVCERSGSICLDVLNQAWTPMYDLVNIFSALLPQLLRYPNPSDPLNSVAAQLLMNQPTQYAAKIRETIANFATKPAVDFLFAQIRRGDEEAVARAVRTPFRPPTADSGAALGTAVPSSGVAAASTAAVRESAATGATESPRTASMDSTEPLSDPEVAWALLSNADGVDEAQFDARACDLELF